MPNTIDYALMAGNAYQRTREKRNFIPYPIDLGWQALDPPFDHGFDDGSGFEATAYKNNTGTEIVISYAGTYSASSRDLIADGELYLGFRNAQLLQAARYYT